MQNVSEGGNWRGTVVMVLASSCLISFGVVEASLAAGQEVLAGKSDAKKEGQWRAVHLMSPGRDGLPLLKRAITEKLAAHGRLTWVDAQGVCRVLLDDQPAEEAKLKATPRRSDGATGLAISWPRSRRVWTS